MKERPQGRRIGARPAELRDAWVLVLVYSDENSFYGQINESIRNVNYLKSIDYTPPNRLRLVLAQHLKLAYIHH